MPETALALDLATATGAAWSYTGEFHPLQSELWRLQGENGARLVQLLDCLQKHRVAHVFLEDVRPRSTRWAFWYYRLAGIVELYADWSGARVQRIRPGALKRWATGQAAATLKDVDLRVLSDHAASLREKGRTRKQADLRAKRTLLAKATKRRMLEAAQERWPEHAEVLASLDDNRIDALWLLDWGLHEIGALS